MKSKRAIADAAGQSFFLDGKVTLRAGDCREVLKSLPDNSIDSVVTDPPYALVSIVKRFANSPRSERTENTENPYGRTGRGFMGQRWDTGETAFAVDFWAEVLRVLKPGGHLVAFSGTRTYHRMACAIEDAGFEIRDQIGWAYGSGFPKSHDVSKGIDKAAGRIGHSIVELKKRLIALADESGKSRKQIDKECGFRACNYLTLPDAGKRFDPWVWTLPTGDKWQVMKSALGTGDELDAAFSAAEREIIGMRKAIPGVAFSSDGPSEIEVTAPATDAAKQWQGWGTALKPAWEPICLARKPLSGTVAANVLEHGVGALNIDGCRVHAEDAKGGSYTVTRLKPGATLNATGGNWRPESGGIEYRGEMKPGRWPANIVHDGSEEVLAAFPDAPGQQRGVGPANGAKDSVHCYGDFGPRAQFDPRGDEGSSARFFYTAKADAEDRLGSKHPTVKPLDLMQWLVRLVTPRGGLVLDPFAGTGTTGEAAWREGMRAVLIEREPEYVTDIARRLDLADKPTKRFAVAKTKNNLADASELPLFSGEAAE
jgi:DNA modification methylase